MKTLLNFDQEETKKLLSKFDYEYFLKRHLEEGKYDKTSIEAIYASYKSTERGIIKRIKEDKQQFNLFNEGQVRKSFTGGHLPSWLGLDETRSITILDFPAVGENWAYFDYWKKYYKRKITREKIWDIVTKVGSILAIILTANTLAKLFISSFYKK